MKHSLNITNDIAILNDIKAWVTNADQCNAWAGDMVRFPFEGTSLEDDIEFKIHQHFTFKSDDELLAFAQLQDISQYHSHIARLIVNSECRNQGIATKFIKSLTQEAMAQKADLRLLTLSVLETNQTAIKIYTNQGFEQYRFIEPDVIQMRLRF